MSYKQPNTGDSLNDYFTSLMNFINVSPHLINSKTDSEFEIWLEKLELIDKRALYFFLKENKNRLPERWIHRAQRLFKKEI